MASVYLTSTNGAAAEHDWWTDHFRLLRSATTCSAPQHSLVDRPEDADVILFSDSRSSTQADVRNHTLTKRHRERVFVYSTNDRDVPLVPGVYVSAEAKWYRPSWMRAGFYVKVIDHDWIQPSPIDHGTRYLFSFCGSFDTHVLRGRLNNVRGDIGLIRDTSKDDGRGFGKSPETYRRWQNEYAQTLIDSMFVLCPRGVAPSSYRIFEAMKAGRAPVIVADEWVPPEGPDWSECSVRIPEARLEETPQILERMTDRAAAMGLRARAEWERWYSSDHAFQTIVGWCVEIKSAQAGCSSIQRYMSFAQLARPFHVRHVLLASAKRALRNGLFC